MGVITDNFEVSSSVSFATGSTFLTAPKRLYAGAYRTNLTGALQTRSDVNIANVKYWTNSLRMVLLINTFLTPRILA